jgi:hypothetical protein
LKVLYFGFHMNTKIGIRHFLAAWRTLQSSNTCPMYRYRQEMLGLSAVVEPEGDSSGVVLLSQVRCMKSPTSWLSSNGSSRLRFKLRPTAEDAGVIGPLVLWPEACFKNGLVMTLPSHQRWWRNITWNGITCYRLLAVAAWGVHA